MVLLKRVGTTTTAPTHTHRTRAAPLLRGILCTSSASPSSSSSSSSSLSSSSSWFNYIMAVIFNNIILIITAAGAIDKSACVRLEWVCYSYGHSPLVICSSHTLPSCLQRFPLDLEHFETLPSSSLFCQFLESEVFFN